MKNTEFNEKNINNSIRDYLNLLEEKKITISKEKIKELKELLSNNDFLVDRHLTSKLIDKLLQKTINLKEIDCELIKDTFHILFREKFINDKLSYVIKTFLILKNRNLDLFNSIYECLKTSNFIFQKKLNSIIYFRIVFFDGEIKFFSKEAIEDLLSCNESVLSPVFSTDNTINQKFLLELYEQAYLKKHFKKNKDIFNIYKVISSKNHNYHFIQNKLKEKTSDDNGIEFYKKLKIAICISGQLRGYDKAYNSWKESGLIHENTDLYISVWDDIGNRRATPAHCHRIFCESFNDLYKKLCIGRNYENVLNSFNNLSNKLNLNNQVNKEKICDFYNSDNVEIENESETGVEFKNNHERMYYKIQKGFSLINNPSSYDLIIRIRPDKIIHSIKEINWSLIKELCDKGAILTDLGNVPNINSIVGLVVGDQFAIGSHRTMDCYSKTYDVFKNIFNLPMRGHNSLGKNLLDNDINIYPFPISSMGELLPPKIYNDYEVSELIKEFDKTIFDENEIEKINYFINNKQRIKNDNFIT